MENITTLTKEDALLVANAKEGDSLAFALLMHKYSNMMRAFISTLSGTDSVREDLLQEGLIGLLKAVRSYDPDKAQFSTYAITCMKNSIITAHRRYNRNAAELPSASPFGELESLDTDSPEGIFLVSESGRLLHDRLFKALSPFEKQVFELYLAEHSYSEIAKALGKDAKSIDNAVQRIRSKLKRIF